MTRPLRPAPALASCGRLALLTLLLCLWGCDGEQPAAPEPRESASSTDSDRAERISNRVWEHFDALTGDTINQVLALQQATQALAASATEATLQETRDAWRRSHQQLLLLSPLFALGQVQTTLFRQLDDARWQADAWPIEPGYLDYFDLYLHSGLVNDIVIPIDAEAVRHQHGFSSEADVVLGLHAMEYLLWGEQGARPLSDFTPAPLNSAQQASGLTATDLPAQRRLDLLQLQAELLLEDLRSLQHRLAHPASGIRKAYQALPPSGRLRLWQQAAVHLLQAMNSEDELLAPAQHAPYAGANRASLQAQLQGLETLLNAGDTQAPSLLQWLAPQQQAEISSNLQGLIAALGSDTSGDDSAPLTEAQHQQLLTLLGLLQKKT